MHWIDAIAIDRSRLFPGASEDLIKQVEEKLGWQFPWDYREFLRLADGGFLGNFILYSAGKGLHPCETLLAANEGRENPYPIIAVGRDSSDDFGFQKVDLPAESCPVYFILHETYDLDKVAESFKEFIIELASLGPGQPFVPRSRRKEKNPKWWKFW